MAATSENPWMAIALSFRRQHNEAVFGVTFGNASSTPQELVFSNRAHKAELVGLRIFDHQGNRVEPVRKFILKPLPDPDGRRWLQPGEHWTYELRGTIAAGNLDFPATSFPVIPGQIYTAQFVYKLIASEKLNFSV